jgi:RNA polymerase sigma-70 factor, ECF subfamily
MHAPKIRQAITPAAQEQGYKLVARDDRRRAMDMVVRDFRSRLFQHAFFIVKDSQEAYDAVQEVFIKAMRETRFFDEEFRMKAWLFRVTSNLCYNIVRDRRRRGGILESLNRPDRTNANQMERVQRGERRDEVLSYMDKLGRNHREILLLRYYHDLSYAEIAEVIDVKLGTVMSRLSRARARLGDVMGREHPVVLEVLERGN